MKQNKIPQIPDIHDWEIVGIKVNRFNHSVVINLYFPDKEINALIRLFGVQKIFLSGMMLQNVILDVLLFETSNNSDYFTHICQLLRIKPSYFEENSEQKILYFEPSVGAELACSFSHLEFLELKGTDLF